MAELNNGWTEWSKYVLKELERLNGNYEVLSRDIGKIREEIAMLKVKAGMWGAVAGCVPVAAMILFNIVK